MWIFTRDGFYSVVNHRDIPHHYLVRGRIEADLQRMLTKVGSTAAITDVAKGDYRWSVPVHKADFTKYMVDELMEMDYSTSVKDHVDLGEPARHTALIRCWTAMMDLQEGRFTSTASAPVSASDWQWDDDLDFDLHDAEEFVSVELAHDGRHEVTIWSAPGEPLTVNVFDREEDANNLARRIRDIVATWDGFVQVENDGVD